MAQVKGTDVSGSENKEITPHTITANGNTFNSSKSSTTTGAPSSTDNNNWAPSYMGGSQPTSPARAQVEANQTKTNNGRSGSYLREEMQASKNATTSTSNDGKPSATDPNNWAPSYMGGSQPTSPARVQIESNQNSTPSDPNNWAPSYMGGKQPTDNNKKDEINHLKDNNEKPGNPDSSAYWQREKDRQLEQERNTETPSYTPQNTPTQTMPTVPTQTVPTTSTQNTLMMNEEEINNLINRIRKVIEELDSYWSYIKNNCMEKVKNSWVADETKTYVDSVLAEDNNVNKIKESLLLLANTYESVRNNVNNTQSENAKYIQNNF